MRALKWMLAVFVGIVSASSVWAQPVLAAPKEPARTVLVVGYADGRNVTWLIGSKPASMWTHMFPRLQGGRPASPSLPPIWALQIAQALEGDDVRVGVSLLVHAPVKQIDVASVTVSRGQVVTVEDLRAFGIEPVTLTLIDAAPLVPFMPTLESVTPDLRIESAEVITAPAAGYRLTLRNLSDTAIASVHVQSYRGAIQAISSMPTGVHGQPLMRPGGQHVLTVTLTGGRVEPGSATWTPEPLDRIVIDGVLWDDGRMSGNQRGGFPSMALQDGRRVQLVRIVDIYRQLLASTSIDLAALEQRVRALPDNDPTLLANANRGLHEARAEALQAARSYRERFSRAADPTSARRWVQTALQRYEEQVAQLIDR